MGKRLRGRAAGRDAARTSSRPQAHAQRTPDRTENNSPVEPHLLHDADPPTVRRMVGDLQQTHGNAYGNQLLTPATVKRAGPATAPHETGVHWHSSWVQSHHEGNRRVVSDDQGKQDRVTLFRSDVLVVRATAGSGTIGTPSVAAIRSAGAQ